ncbi:membrane metallo-endopeptidase-like 1 isoform X2 [Fopius arisanus]|uniref:Membrane metallo-endopeptidase-like 1 isoform X2 n=1 Tax=Fopius arisanus TaxID=64838 RepID=A0A9R1T8S0_9HYME|nr:PREDICTED: membrane metallo-endopeptidase-like 1 isoform X2 [Fopius arisanus]
MFQFNMWSSLNFKVILTLALISLSQSIPVKRDADLLPTVQDLLNSLDETANPCTDFYKYSCGHWVEHHPPIPGYPMWSNLYMLQDHMRPKLEPLLTANDSESDNEAIRKARKVYRACTNEALIEELGAAPLLSLLNAQGGWPLLMKPEDWKSKNIQWQKIVPRVLKTLGTPTLFSFDVKPDYKDADTPIIAIGDPPLTVKKTELTDPASESVVEAYNQYKSKVADILQQASGLSSEGLTTAEQLTELGNFEKELAEIVEGEHSVKVIDSWYNVMTIDEIQSLYDSAGATNPTAQINWLQMIRDVFALTPEIEINGSERILTPAKNYFKKLAALLDKTSSQTIVNYIMWRVVSDTVVYGNEELRTALILFTNARVGVDPISDRDAECSSASQMAAAVSYAFTTKYSSPETKQTVTDMVGNIKDAMGRVIERSSWVDTATKNVAIDKIQRMAKSVSYPDYFSNSQMDKYFSEFQPSENYFANELEKRKLKQKTLLRQLHKPTDKHVWPVEPTDVNAVYIAEANTMLAPAGILQPPVFDLHRPSIFNYATAGVMLGHEVSHALDSEGRRYDKRGNVVTWWTQPSIDRYNQNAQCFVDQFSSYKLFDDEEGVIFLNGNLTLEENISDSMGLELAWDAYKLFRTKQGTGGDKIPGLEKFTDDQIFFLAYANLWCSTEEARTSANSDVHSPARQRIMGSVSNNEGFATAFNCPANSVMNPSKKCNIWK